MLAAYLHCQDSSGRQTDRHCTGYCQALVLKLRKATACPLKSLGSSKMRCGFPLRSALQ
jgi:hypothetical protein